MNHIGYDAEYYFLDSDPSKYFIRYRNSCQVVIGYIDCDTQVLASGNLEELNVRHQVDLHRMFSDGSREYEMLDVMTKEGKNAFLYIDSDDKYWIKAYNEGGFNHTVIPMRSFFYWWNMNKHRIEE